MANMTSAVPKTARAQAMDTTTDRPPYAMAGVAFLVVLAGYVFSLAPTVTFWDAGEFIASSHILGIPHPPGTPLFVLLGRVWDMLIPGLTTAVKTNLMSATFSAGAAGFLFLFLHETLRAGSKGMDEASARLFRVGGAFAATICGAFCFTNWQNSNETEVYQVAMFSIGLIAWLCWLWRRDRGGVRGAHEMLLLIYVLGAALGNHLMALLCGPAIIAYLFYVLRSDPARDPAERAVQWAQWACTSSLWVVMVGVGIASRGIIVMGLIAFLAAAVMAFRARSGLFAIMAFLVAAAGISTYAYLYIRAGLHPFISEADPSTWQNLWAVIGREQYPPRGPLDNPMFSHGPDNPGRTLKIFGLQIMNYFQYFDWQWSAALQKQIAVFAPARLPFSLLFLALGVYGAIEHRKWDRGTWWFIFGIFATTSIGLIIYLNFKPGFALGYDSFPDREAHEVRERDYFYTVSYVFWGLWAGCGIAAVFQRLRERFAARPLAVAPVFLIALLPFGLNFGAASRHHGAAAMLPRDFAYDMLIGVEPYGILFTNGDNDTFPLWYIQEVEEVRQDVMVVNLSLINTDWYIRQLRDLPARPYRPDANALKLFGPAAGPPPSCTEQQLDSLNVWADRSHRKRPDLARGRPMCLHTLTDDQIATIEPRLLPGDLHFRAGNIQHTYAANTPMYVKDIMVLRLLQEQMGKRPIWWALTAGTDRMGLSAYVSQQGFNFKLWPDSVHAAPPARVDGALGTVMDVERTRTLAWDVYRYARLFDVDSLNLEPTDENIAGNLAFVYYSLGDAFRRTGDIPQMIANYRKYAHLSPNPEVAQFIHQMEAVGNGGIPGLGTDSTAARDTAKAATRPPRPARASPRDSSKR